ncbi:unnamed protein product, partial [Prorocentrum cordatum]
GHRRLPLHPRLGHMALRAGSLGQTGPALSDVAELCAALEGDRDVVRGAGGRPAGPESADLRVRLRALQGEPPASKSLEIVPSRRAEALRSASELRRRLPGTAGSLPVVDPGPLLALAYPERVARRGGGGEYVLRDGTSCKVKDPELQKEPFLAVARLQKSVVVLATPLKAADAAAAMVQREVV